MKKIFSLLILTVAFCAFAPVEIFNAIVTTQAEAAQYRQVQAMHILVPTQKKAQEIREEIVAGNGQQEVFENFMNAAKKYSKCPSGKSGGILGWFGRGDMVPEFEKAAFELPAGQVSEPVKTQFGWHLIYVISKR